MSSDRKNRKILFIVIDQMRADCLSGALAEHVDLPNIRALQQDAVRFDQHFTVITPCGPSRCSLLTGQYGMNHRAIRNGTPLRRGTPNVATESRKAGYEPLLFGYNDTTVDPTGKHPNDPDLIGYEHVMEGFRELLEMRLEESYPWRANLKAQGYDIPDYSDFYNPIPENPGDTPKPNDPPFYSAEHSDTAFLTDSFLRDMAVRTDQNWFAHLTYIRPHPPLVAPVPYNTMYDPDDMPPTVPSGQYDAFTQLAAGAQGISGWVKGCDVDESDTQTLRSIYLGLATEVDHHIGRVIGFLKDTGQYDNTLIVLTADHGEMLGDHGLWGKQHAFDRSYHVPLIIRDPDYAQTRGTVINELTQSIDVTPTILDFIGVPVPKSMNGQSLRPFLAGTPSPDWPQSIHMELDFADKINAKLLGERGISDAQANLAILRNKQFKLVHFNSGFDPLLFDIKADPEEQTNLATDPAYGQTLLEMTQALLSHRMRHMDQSLSERP